MKAYKSVNLLGITIDNKFNFNKHVTKVCDKVSQNLHIVAGKRNCDKSQNSFEKNTF